MPEGGQASRSGWLGGWGVRIYLESLLMTRMSAPFSSFSLWLSAFKSGSIWKGEMKKKNQINKKGGRRRGKEETKKKKRKKSGLDQFPQTSQARFARTPPQPVDWEDTPLSYKTWKHFGFERRTWRRAEVLTKPCSAGAQFTQQRGKTPDFCRRSRVCPVSMLTSVLRKNTTHKVKVPLRVPRPMADWAFILVNFAKFTGHVEVKTGTASCLSVQILDCIRKLDSVDQEAKDDNRKNKQANVHSFHLLE